VKTKGNGRGRLRCARQPAVCAVCRKAIEPGEWYWYKSRSRAKTHRLCAQQPPRERGVGEEG